MMVRSAVQVAGAAADAGAAAANGIAAATVARMTPSQTRFTDAPFHGRAEAAAVPRGSIRGYSHGGRVGSALTGERQHDAARGVIRADPGRGRVDLGTAILGVGAAGAEAAARGNVERRGDVA